MKKFFSTWRLQHCSDACIYSESCECISLNITLPWSYSAQYFGGHVGCLQSGSWWFPLSAPNDNIIDKAEITTGQVKACVILQRYYLQKQWPKGGWWTFLVGKEELCNSSTVSANSLDKAIWMSQTWAMKICHLLTASVSSSWSWGLISAFPWVQSSHPSPTSTPSSSSCNVTYKERCISWLHQCVKAHVFLIALPTGARCQNSELCFWIFTF